MHNIKKLARQAGINFDPADPNDDDGIDTWYGDQYLPSGALQRFAELVVASERAKIAECESIIKDLTKSHQEIYIRECEAIKKDGEKSNEIALLRLNLERAQSKPAPKTGGQVPLTEAQIERLVRGIHVYTGSWEEAVARAIEKAHRIGKEPQE